MLCPFGPVPPGPIRRRAQDAALAVWSRNHRDFARYDLPDSLWPVEPPPSRKQIMRYVAKGGPLSGGCMFCKALKHPAFTGSFLIFSLQFYFDQVLH